MSNQETLDLARHFPVVTCRACQVPMTLRRLEPIVPAADLYMATFHCDRCGMDIERELKAPVSKRSS